MTVRERLLEFLRVPHEPAPPAGDEAVRIFRASANFLRYLFVKWVLKQVGALFGIWMALRFFGSWSVPGAVEIGGRGVSLPGNMLGRAFYLFELVAIAGYVVQAVWSFLLLKLDFEQRWYIVSDRSVRIRAGLVRMHEKTMTFANIQNVSVQQGPLQRLLGIADVQVRSAGGGNQEADPTNAKGDMHVAFFHGVANATAIRDAILERLRVYRDSGLGDPDDDTEPHMTERSVPLLEAAQQFAREAQLLRLAVTAPHAWRRD